MIYVKITNFIKTIKYGWKLFKESPIAFSITLFIMLIICYGFYVSKKELKRM